MYVDGSNIGSLGLNARTILSKGFLIGYHFSGGGNVSVTDLNFEPAGGQNDYASVGAWLEDPGVRYTRGATYTQVAVDNNGNVTTAGSLIRSSGQVYVIANGTPGGTCRANTDAGPSGNVNITLGNCTYSPNDPVTGLPLAGEVQLLHNFKGHGGKLNAAAYDFYNDANGTSKNAKGPIARGANSWDGMVEFGPGNGPLIYHAGDDLWITGTSGGSTSNQIELAAAPTDGSTLGQLVITRSAFPNVLFDSDDANLAASPPTYTTITTNVTLSSYNTVSLSTSNPPQRNGVPLPSPFNDQAGTTQQTGSGVTAYATPIGTREVLVQTTSNVTITLPPAPNIGDRVCYEGTQAAPSMITQWLPPPVPTGSAAKSLQAGQAQCFTWSGSWTNTFNNGGS